MQGTELHGFHSFDPAATLARNQIAVASTCVVDRRHDLRRRGYTVAIYFRLRVGLHNRHTKTYVDTMLYQRWSFSSQSYKCVPSHRKASGYPSPFSTDVTKVLIGLLASNRSNSNCSREIGGGAEGDRGVFSPSEAKAVQNPCFRGHRCCPLAMLYTNAEHASRQMSSTNQHERIYTLSTYRKEVLGELHTSFSAALDCLCVQMSIFGKRGCH